MLAAEAGQFPRAGEPPSRIERILLCERLAWRLLPWELDEIDLEALDGALNELWVYKVFAKYAADMKTLSAHEAELVGQVETWRAEAGWTAPKPRNA
jgi:hypothetical protein